MRALILAAGAALTLSACGGGSEANNTAATDANATAMDANMMATDNMAMDANMTMNGADMNGNMGVDPATQNMIQQDMNTNSPDTNLANGM
jgi:hypothetical protein